MPLHNPVALTDRRKSSIFILLLLLLFRVSLVVLSPPLIPQWLKKHSLTKFYIQIASLTALDR
jgi:hypothetical protein